MTVTTNTATVRRAATKALVGNGEGSNLKHLGARTVEIAASESASTIDFGNIPADLRIAGCSRLYWDDLATSGSPTLDLGLFAVNSNITDDDDALIADLALSSVSTANVGSRIVSDIANFGKKAYEYVNGQSTNPGGQLKIKGTIKDASTTATGTVTLDLYAYID